MAACDLDEAAAQDTVRLLGSPGSEEGAPRGKHAAFQADVSQGPAARRLLEQVQACFSRPPSVVVSCAGITRDEFLLHMSEEDWDRVIAVNLKVVISKPGTCARPQPGEVLGGRLPPQLILPALLPSRARAPS